MSVRKQQGAEVEQPMEMLGSRTAIFVVPKRRDRERITKTPQILSITPLSIKVNVLMFLSLFMFPDELVCLLFECVNWIIS